MSQDSLSDSVTETLIHSISSSLAYCNATLSGLPSKTLNRLQYVQHSATKVLTCTKPWQQVTPILMQLNCIPVKSCISYKVVLLLTYKSLHALTPQYLTDFLCPYAPLWSLWSSTHQTEVFWEQSLLCDCPHNVEQATPPYPLCPLWACSKSTSKHTCSPRLSVSNSLPLPPFQRPWGS